MRAATEASRIRGENSVTRNAHFANVETSRIRGESLTEVIPIRGWLETSPHTRGKLWPYGFSSIGSGNIPHTRGKREPAADRVHDAETSRIRGESGFQEEKTWLDRNIPAYAGKAGRFGDRRSTFRKHPAYAGKADAHLPEDGSLQKHPRIRGESGVIRR